MPARSGDRTLHWAWVVAPVTFLTLVGSAAFRSVPGVLMDPLHTEFGWSHGTIGFAVAVNMVLFGLISPFAAALMDRFGIRRGGHVALVMISVGSGLTVFMTAAWQLVLCWGVLVGRRHRLDVDGVRRDGGEPLVRRAARSGERHPHRRQRDRAADLPAGGRLDHHPCRMAHGGADTAAAALAVVPLIVFLMRDHPADLGLRAYGATDEDPGPPPHQAVGSSAGRALRVLREATRTPAFWLLAGGFAICGATTNGLIATHFIPAAMDHGMPPTTAASLLALVGLFDVGGTIAPGWFTDRVDPRYLLLAYYSLRGVGLVVLPSLLAPHARPGTWVFVIFYGLDWVATVPPTVMLCREWFGAEAGSIVFGWVFASHQIGASAMALGAGADPRPHRQLRPGVLPRGRAVCGRGGALGRHPAADHRGRPPSRRRSRRPGTSPCAGLTRPCAERSAGLGEADGLGDLPAAERLVDRDHRAVARGVPGVGRLDVGSLGAQPVEHGQLQPQARAGGRGGGARTEVSSWAAIAGRSSWTQTHRDAGGLAGGAVPRHDGVRVCRAAGQALLVARGSRSGE